VVHRFRDSESKVVDVFVPEFCPRVFIPIGAPKNVFHILDHFSLPAKQNHVTDERSEPLGSSGRNALNKKPEHGNEGRD
jgi:hypothetical protein